MVNSQNLNRWNLVFHKAPSWDHWGFSLNVLPVGHIIKSFGLQYHMYADDVQLYTSFNPNDHVSITSALNNLSSCIDALKIWMQNNMLKLNDDKTEFFVAVPTHLKRNVLPVSLNIGDKSISPSQPLTVFVTKGLFLIPKCQCLVTSLLCALA